MEGRELEGSRMKLEMDDEQVKSFVAKFPTQEQPLDCRAVDAVPSRRRRLFWNKTITALKPQRKSARRRISSSSSSSSASSCCTDDADVVWRRWKVHEKIKSAFSMVNTIQMRGLMQFWAPTVDETKSSTTLSTSCQPFALDDLASPRLFDYRLFSTNYRLPQSVVDHGDHIDPLATAFLTQFPQVVLDLRKIAHKAGSPLVNKAIDCGLTCLILLPLFYSTSSYCVGVVECCIDVSLGLLTLFQLLNRALKLVGLSTYHVKQRLKYEPNHRLSHAKDEIEKTLKIVCESLHLTLAQVWIDRSSVTHGSFRSSPSLSSLEEEEEENTHLRTKQTLTYLVKLCGYVTDPKGTDAGYSANLDYYGTCDVLALKIDDALVGPTLRTHKSAFCEDVNNLGGDNGLYGILCRRTKCSRFTVCLRSTHTGTYVDYGFEFLWPKSRNHSILLESLLLMLKMCLPSFKFASGAQLGDEVRVIDIDNCKATRKMSSFTILPGNWFSQTPKASKEEELPRPEPAKRKLSDLYPGKFQTDSDSDSDSDLDSDSYNNDAYVAASRAVEWYLIAKCRGTLKDIVLYISYTLADVKKEVEKVFNLDNGTYTMEYQLKGDGFVINTDEDLSLCVERWKRFIRKSITTPLFTVHVLPYADQTHTHHG